MEILIITGPPYSGKGTQCEILKEILSFKHISTGDRLREEKEKETKIGNIAKEYESRGDLVPNSTMEELINQIIEENISEKGIILDGYPRTQNQVDTLINLLEKKNLKISKVLNIEVPHEELLERAKKRAETSKRVDDQNPQTHFKRIKIFEESTRPSIEYMKTILEVVSIDGLGTIEEITRKIKQMIS